MPRRKKIPVPAKQQIETYRENYPKSFPQFETVQFTPSGSSGRRSRSPSPGPSGATFTASQPLEIISAESLQKIEATSSTEPRKKKQKTKHQEPQKTLDDMEQLKASEFLGMTNEQFAKELETEGSIFNLVKIMSDSKDDPNLLSFADNIINMTEEEFNKYLNENIAVVEKKVSEASIFSCLTISEDEATETAIREKMPKKRPQENIQESLEEELEASGDEYEDEYEDEEDAQIRREEERIIIKRKCVTQKQRRMLLEKLKEDLKYLYNFMYITSDLSLKLVVYDAYKKIEKEIEMEEKKIRFLQAKAKCKSEYRARKKAKYEEALKNPDDEKNKEIIKKYEETRYGKHQKAYQKAYQKACKQSERRKATIKAYEQSEKGKQKNRLNAKRQYIKKKIKKAELENNQALVETLKKELEETYKIPKEN